jgi:hypothetical protein
MKPVSDEAELDLRCAFGDKKPCMFAQFLLDQNWIPGRCENRALAHKLFYEILRSRDYKTYKEEYE